MRAADYNEVLEHKTTKDVHQLLREAYFVDHRDNCRFFLVLLFPFYMLAMLCYGLFRFCTITATLWREGF